MGLPGEREHAGPFRRGMTMNEGETPTVLFVDDERAVADGHAARLSDQYRTRTAYDGRTALDEMDDSVDVVFLDRRMPRMSGEEALEDIREQGYDCHVVMLTGIEPDEDVVEMGFDEYLVKPIREPELRETVERLLSEPPDGEDDILDVLGDPKTRRCFYALVDEYRSARDLADLTDYSLPTVYRHLQKLRQAGMIEAQITVDPRGNHYKMFTTSVSRIQIEVGDGVQVDVERDAESA